MKKICFSDATLVIASNLSFKEKIEIARQLEKLNVSAIELGEILNIKSDTLLVKTIASFVKNSTVSVSAGFTEEGVNNAANALVTAAKPRIKIEIPVSTVGMEYTCHIKAPMMIELVKQLVALAKQKGVEAEFCALDATRAEEKVLKEAVLSAVEAGADIVTICDASTEMLPEKFGEFIEEIVTYTKDTKVKLSVNCSNKNGLAAAKAVTAVDKGVEIVTTDVLSRNVPLDNMAEIVRDCGQNNGFSTDLKFTELNRIIKQINWVLGNGKSENSVAVISDSATTVIALQKSDSVDTVKSAVAKLGYDLTEEDCAKVYEEFLRVAEKKNVTDKELEAIVASVALQVPPTYKLISYVINNGNIISSSAQITLEKNGETLQGVCIGNGPIEASFFAIEQIIGFHYELDDFQIQSVTEGKEAMGSALVRLRSNGKLYSGNGISTDIMGASIRAYINAVNKIVYEEGNR